MKKHIPVHHFGDDLDSEIQFRLVPLEKRTEYDTSIPHRHNYYEVFFFTKGGGIHMIDFTDYKLQSHSMHVVFPGQVHLVRRELDSYGFVLLFSNDFYYLNKKGTDALSDIPNKLRSNFSPVLNLRAKEFSALEDTIEKIEQEISADSIFKKDILKSYLDIILFHARRAMESTQAGNELKKKNASYEMYYRFSEILESSFTQFHRPSDYAEKLSVTEKHLNEFTKNVCGKTVTELIHERLILEMKRLLTHSTLSAKEISHALNFDDPSYFVKFFKRATSITPKEFQDNFRKKYHF